MVRQFPVYEICDRAADFLRRLRGWRRMGVACIAGVLSALAFAPFGIFPLLLLSLAILVLLLDSARTTAHPVWASAFTGWAYGFGQFAAGLYWVAYAFLVDPLQHAWQIPFVALLFPGGLALFIACACALSSAFWRGGWPRVCAFTVAYAFAEWLRGNILTGFPWNLPGYGWGASLAILQSVALFGVYGLSLLTILLGASLALFCGPKRAPIVPVVLSLVFMGLWLGGMVRLSFSPTQYVPGVRLRIVQPNVAEADKYRPNLRTRHWQELIDLSRVQHGAPPTHIIWPEAAPPFVLARAPQALSDVAALTAKGAVLLTGAARVEPSSGEKPVFYNSFYIFGRDAQLLATYDKFHLVPFGEYVPFPHTLHAFGIDKLVDQPGSFAGGDGPHTYTIPGAPPVGPLICYEVLFPGEVAANPRPGWFVNVTDDSWFGPASSTGPYQHFLTARIRAIEEGIPIVRAANTGISAVIDPLGRVILELGINRAGVLDTLLPQAVSPTPFGQVHEMLFWAMLFGCMAVALTATFRRS